MITNVLAKVLNAVALLVLMGASLPVIATQACGPNRFTVGCYLELQSASLPRLSPDGAQVAYMRSIVDTMDDRQETAIWLVDTNGRYDRFLAKGSDPVWSPDSRRIAYVGEGQPKGKQIFVLHLDVPGPATQITSVERDPSDLHWSPDGRRIGFTMFVASPEKWKVDIHRPPEGAKWASAPWYTERFHWRRDGVGLMERGFRHLFLIDADGGAPREITPGDWSIDQSVYEEWDHADWAFTPDGRSAIVEGLKDRNEDRNDEDCYIYSVDLATGVTKQLITTPGAWRMPTVSPDGKTIAYVGFRRNDEAYRVSDLWTMSADGSNQRLRSHTFDREPLELEWAPDSSAVYFTAEDHGSIHLYEWSARRNAIRSVTRGAEVVTDASVSRSSIVFMRSDFSSPGDIELISRGHPSAARQLTHLNDELLYKMALATEQEISVKSTGGVDIQGWIVKPPDFDASKRYPLLLEIHGGPDIMSSVAFNPSFQNFAANGYVILYVNPRGSSGYGSAFGNAINKHYPGVDYDDLMASVNAIEKERYIDPTRMYVAGCSGGGTLSSWVIGHTSRFAAAAVRCPVTDWISFAGDTDIPYFAYRYFKKPFWEDPSDWLKESPLMYVGNVKTPTLLMTGELDRRTPIAQTEELYQALKYRGIPAALLRFDDEFHGTRRKPSNWMRTQLYMMSWFARYGARSGGPPR